jgi:hypothetical protein
MQAQQWPDTPVEARPGARWWWLGSAVDEKNLTYNLEEYARTGMGAVEITPIYGVQGNDANEIQFLSPRWMEMLKHTQTEGKRTGIEIDMNTGTGWPFGGPEVSIEDAATKAIFQTYEIEGGKEIEQDINVTDPKQQPFSVLSRVMAYDEKGKCINLTAHVKKDKLQWKAPAGKWKVIALYIGKTRQKVKRAAPGGEGYVMNHLSKKGGKKIIFPALTVLSKVARQVIHILSSTIHTKFIKLTGRMISWNSSLVDGGINWKNISPNSWIKTVRKLADVSCRITGKPFPTSYWRTSVINGQTGHTKTVVSPVIRHMVRPVI